jgi:hypothetical protein
MDIDHAQYADDARNGDGVGSAGAVGNYRFGQESILYLSWRF